MGEITYCFMERYPREIKEERKEIKDGFRLCCIGHITHDRVITPEIEKEIPGGTAYYFAKALACLKADNFLLLTKVGKDSEYVLEELEKDGIEVKNISSRETVFFENRYDSNLNDRAQRVLSKADSFELKNLKDIKADVYHLGTLLADDFSSDFIKYLSQRGIVSVDIQGYLRQVEGKEVISRDFKEKIEILPFVDILKVNENEMETLTGVRDPYEAARIISEWGVGEIHITMGALGAVVYKDGNYYNIKAYKPKRLTDATGCGDTYMAGYLYQRCKGSTIVSAAKFASAMCALKLEDTGPFHGCEDDVNLIISS